MRVSVGSPRYSNQAFLAQGYFLAASASSINAWIVSSKRRRSNSKNATPRQQIAIRAVILIALGFVIWATLSPLVFIILDVYGVAFLLMLPLLFLRPAVALGLGAGLLAVTPALAELGARTEFVAQVRDTPFKFLSDWVVGGAYPVIVWVPVMLIGLALARMDLGSPRVVGLVAWFWLSRAGGEESPYRLATVERDDLEAIVSATGKLNAVTTVQVGTQVSGQIRLNGEDVMAMSFGQLRAVRWAQAAVVFQGAMHALNPVQRIETQLAEPILLHDDVGPGALQLGHQRGEIGRGGGVAFLQHHVEAGLLGALFVALGDVHAIGAVLVDDGHAQVLGVLPELGLGVLGHEVGGHQPELPTTRL